jgi:hypothetical protein
MGVAGALALFVLLALPAPPAAAQTPAAGIANVRQAIEFSSRNRRYRAHAVYAGRRCSYNYRPYLCYGAPFAVPVRTRYWR